MFDVCVLGHITKDLIRIPGKPDRQMAGGSAYYAALALKRLGLDVAVVTKVARADATSLLSALEDQGIALFNGETATTTVFENAYADPKLTSRRQRVRSIAEPFGPDDLDGIEARAFHLGPLTGGELPISVLETARDRGEIISFDAQGMIRRVRDGVVELGTWSEIAAALRAVDILKVDDIEAEKLAAIADPEKAALRLARLGPKEVLVTFADRGSLVLSSDGPARVPAIPPARRVDATGCGDTYAAGYLFRRLEGAPPVEAGWFAAASASLKLERYGAFDLDAAAVHDRVLEGQSALELKAAVGR